MLLEGTPPIATSSYLLEIPLPSLEEGGFDILIDARYGSLSTYRRAGLSLGNVRAILVSHAHLDHTADLLPAILLASFNRRPVALLANATVIKGRDGQPPLLTDYFRLLGRAYAHGFLLPCHQVRYHADCKQGSGSPRRAQR